MIIEICSQCFKQRMTTIFGVNLSWTWPKSATMFWCQNCATRLASESRDSRSAAEDPGCWWWVGDKDGWRDEFWKCMRRVGKDTCKNRKACFVVNRRILHMAWASCTRTIVVVQWWIGMPIVIYECQTLLEFQTLRVLIAQMAVSLFESLKMPLATMPNAPYRDRKTSSVDRPWH